MWSAKRPRPKPAPMTSLLKVLLATAARIAKVPSRRLRGCGTSRVIDTVTASTSNSPSAAAPMMAPAEPK
jgi:hypothetical protein